MVGRTSDRLVTPIPRHHVAIDIETTGLDPHRDQITAISLYCDQWTEPFEFYDTRKWTKIDATRELGRYFRTDDYVLIGHNISFDLAFIKQQWGINYPPASRIWDTKIAEQVITAGYEEMRNSLKDVLERYFKIALDKSLQTSFSLYNAKGEYYEYTPEQIGYARGDVEFLSELAKEQAALLTDADMAVVWDIERNVMPVFAEMWRYGVEVDLERLQPLLDAAERTRARLENILQLKLTEHVEWKRLEQHEDKLGSLNEYLVAELRAIEFYEEMWQARLTHNALDSDVEAFGEGILDHKINKKDGKPEGQRRYIKANMKLWREQNKRPPKPNLTTGLINLKSNPQMMAAFEHMGIDTPNMRGKTLARLVVEYSENEEIRETLQELMEYKKACTLLQSFGEKLIERMGPDGRLHGKFNQIGTQTGRPSCQEPNMLNMPKNNKFRACFRASSGKLFIVCDYSQMELRIMCQLSKDVAMRKAFTDGLDLHAYTASLMFKKPIEQTGDETKERQIAKTINFGILYGMGPNKLRETLAGEGVIISKQEALDFINLWKTTYRQAAAMIEELQQQAVTVGYTSTPFGRRRHFHLNFKEKSERFAAARAGGNHPIQGTNADISKLAMCMIQHYLGDRGTVILQIYDEIVCEVDEEVAEWALGVVSSCMVKAAEEVLTDIPAKVDPMISRSWSKKDKVA